MHTHELPPRDRVGAARRAAAGLLALSLLAAPVRAAEPPPFAARAGLDIASAAAQAWSSDAVLVYVENDEAVDDAGAAARWGYLFYSGALEKARGYSVRNGRILVAEDLPMKFEAPPLAGDWMDSGAALQAAERGAGGEFRSKERGRLSTMLLMRGAFAEGDPDETTWTLIYTSPDASSLFVVVDASGGKVRRTWRG
jgi:hypothetical protein